MKQSTKIFIGILFLIAASISAYLLYDRGRPAPIPMKETLFEGVVYRRLVRLVPRPMIAHIVRVDRETSNAAFLVTPADSEGSLPLNARTTSRFLDEFDVQIAINGDGFDPWWSRSPVDYYPREGDPVNTHGLAASNGDLYSTGRSGMPGKPPTLYFTRLQYPSFDYRPSRVWTAISGDRTLVTKGQVADGLDSVTRQPRTAIGISRNGQFVYLVVVDGRQPFYSDGATFLELAELLLEQGAYFAMSLDGGGSSTLVIEGADGEPILLNSPIDNFLPGRERPVANHFGVYVNP